MFIEETCRPSLDTGRVPATGTRLLVVDGVKVRAKRNLGADRWMKTERRDEASLDRHAVSYDETPVAGTEILRLGGAHGFAALKRGVMRVTTPYVLSRSTIERSRVMRPAAFWTSWRRTSPSRGVGSRRNDVVHGRIEVGFRYGAFDLPVDHDEHLGLELAPLTHLRSHALVNSSPFT